MHRPSVRAALTTAAATLALAGCSLAGTGDEAQDPATSSAGGTSEAGGTVVLATHESFTLPKKLVKQFEAETGYQLEVRAAGDAGTLATKLSLTADNPIADAAFGVDNTFASRPLDEGAFAEVAAVGDPAGGVRPRRGRRPARPDRLRQRVRQRRHRLVRRGGHRAAADAGRPHRPGVRRPAS